jgi:hypothetical protein
MSYKASLKGYWPLDENSGSTAADYSGENNDGTITGTTLGVSGPVGSTAYDFQSEDYVTFQSWDTYFGNPVSNQATIGLWTRAETVSSFQETMEDLSNVIRIVHKSDGTVDAGVADGDNLNVVNISISQNTWHQILMTLDNGSIKVYKDGLLEGRESFGSIDSRWNDDPVQVGGNSAWFDGQISNIRIYDRALSPQEVAYLHEVSQHGQFHSDRREI